MIQRRQTVASRRITTVGEQGASPLWGLLVQMGYNTYADRDAPEFWTAANNPHLSFSPSVRFDRATWNELVEAMVAAGMNAVVIGMAEAVRFESHPELAGEGAWTIDELREELARLRGLGIEPIPKLNFSTAHDAWLGPYGRCVSTEPYYRVCADLIAEAIAAFDTPRFFHLGYDEENLENQRHYDYVVIRQHDLWWHDFLFFVEQVERAGVRPWIWSDYIWDHLDEFAARMPRTVVQSNWYYDPNFDLAIDEANYQRSRATHGKDSLRDERTRTTPLRAYLELERLGFDQIPAGSINHTYGQPIDNFEGTVRFCAERIAPERLLGFLQTVWRPVLPEFRDRHLASIEFVRRAKAAYEGRG
jgi:hypothetical protein